jgi:reverse gyrase
LKRIVGAQLNESLTRWFNNKLNETHKTQTDLLTQIIEAYIDFEKAGYLGEDGNKIRDLETKIQLTEKLRQAEAGRYQDKLDFQKELVKQKDQEAKERARDRAARNQPKVDWGNVAVGSGDSFMLGDE